jgi:hypothetical protein
MWNTTPEWFTFLAARFDVQRAKQCLSQKARKVGTMPIQEVARLVGAPDKVMMGISVDWDRVQNDPSIDLSVPVILAWTKAGSLLPIDGWHRIARAKLEGIPSLPAVVLTKAESKRCWM